jgi:hypothetical protein
MKSNLVRDDFSKIINLKKHQTIMASDSTSINYFKVQPLYFRLKNLVINIDALIDHRVTKRLIAEREDL